MTRREMATDFCNVFDQDSESVSGNNGASNLDRHIKVPHIRACTNCVRAKAKCITSQDPNGKCERCHRMDKDCQPSPPVRKRRIAKRPAQRSANKTSKLEEKLDGLVTLLKSAATQGTPGIINATSLGSTLEGSVPSTHDNAPGSTATGRASYRDFTDNGLLVNGSVLPESAFTLPTPAPSTSTSANLQNLLHPALEPSPEEAELYLNKFRTDFVKHLPFIVIPPTMTAHQLRQERPILWVCIMSAASNNSTQQIALSKEVRGILAREAYVEGTRNMDLLLAVLVYAAWDRRHTLEKPIITCLVQLAIAVLYDLRLDKPSSKDPVHILVYELKGVGKPSRLSRPPTMEERRALLGCFLMSSATSSCLRKVETLRWTAYLDECLQVIETEKECASDALLVQLVKLRLISEKVVEAPWSGSVTEVNYSRRPPAMFYMKSLEVHLRDFKSNIPPELMDNKTLLMELYNVELTLYEIGFSQAPDIFSGPYNRRLECLCTCLNVAKSWVDTFLSILPAQYVGFSGSIYQNMIGGFIGIYQLATFEHPEWNRDFVQKNLDVRFFLDEAEKNFAQVKEAAGLDIGGSEDVDFFSIMASRIRLLKTLWDPTAVSTTASLGAAPSDEMSDFPVELFDDEWLTELFGPLNKQWA